MQVRKGPGQQQNTYIAYSYRFVLPLFCYLKWILVSLTEEMGTRAKEFEQEKRKAVCNEREDSDGSTLGQIKF